jgi:hypothetical protein
MGSREENKPNLEFESEKFIMFAAVKDEIQQFTKGKKFNIEVGAGPIITVTLDIILIKLRSTMCLASSLPIYGRKHR